MKSRFKNLAEPMIMNEHDAILFSGRNVCLFCEGTLQPKYVAYDTFQVECVRCKAVLKEGPKANPSNTETESSLD